MSKSVSRLLKWIQVEVLTAELDELAARQGGNGVIEADGKSWKSIKSSSLEIEGTLSVFNLSMFKMVN